MKLNALSHWTFFIVIVLLSSASSAQSISSDNGTMLVEKFSYKNYEDGTRAGYFTLDGNYTLKDLHRVEQYFADMDMILTFSIFDKDPEKARHTVFIKSNDEIVTKGWIRTQLTHGINAGKFSVLWNE